MSYSRIHNKRDANEPEIVRAFESYGCKVIRQDKDAGFDLLILIPHQSRSALVEVKNPEADIRLTKLESNLQIWCILHAIYYEVVYRAEQVPEIITELSRI